MTNKIDFGAVVGADGALYYLTEQAEPTSSASRPGEWSARAKSANGDDYRVYWIFDAPGDEDREPDEYDWDAVDRIEER